MQVGDSVITKISGICTITNIFSGTQIEVTFEDGYKKLCRPEAFNRANIKNPYYPSVFGIGYIGEGAHKWSIKKVPTREGIVWRSLLQRCYDPAFINKHLTYKDCYVCDDWHSFQNFADWCQNQIGFGSEGWCLDKDIINKGNKTYAPEFCAFVPPAINNLIINNKAIRGKYPIGVSFHTRMGKFVASCNVRGRGQVQLGTFSNSDDAFQCYKIFKEKLIKDVAEEYKDIIDKRVYDALLSWEVSVDD